MNTKAKITFICTDNLGRSVVAEYCAKDYLCRYNINDFIIMSAGTDADSDSSNFSFAHYDRLKDFNISVDFHKRTQLNKKIIDFSDFIIAMGEEHRAWINKFFSAKALLFNEVYKNKKTSIDSSFFGAEKNLDAYMVNMADYIYEATPTVIKNLKKLK